MNDFVHLHVHTDYSLLDGAAKVKPLVARAAALEMKALAITDHGNMCGAFNFEKECIARGVKPIIGCEFYVAGGFRGDKAGTEEGNRYYHLILLARNQTGYRNLVYLSSRSYTEGFYYKPRIDRELIETYHEGLICLSACIAGELPQLLLNNKIDKAEELARSYQEIFGEGHYYIELQDHGLEDQQRASSLLIDLARRTGIPLVLTNDSHFVERDDGESHEVLTCIGQKISLSDPKHVKFYQSYTKEHYLKSADEMAALFSDYPETIINTARIAEMCETVFVQKTDKKTGEPAVDEKGKPVVEVRNSVIPKFEVNQLKECLPVFEIPQDFPNDEAYIRHLVMSGLEERYGDVTEAIRSRAEFELNTIISMGFSGYFLIVWDFINWSKEHDIPIGPGRGSGAGSIVAYAMGITNIDPLRYNLLFERFLNPERISMPDFDIDISNEGRHEVIEYTRRKYGDPQVGHIVTFGTLKAKQVIKDVGRVLEIPLAEVNALTDKVPDHPKAHLNDAFTENPKISGSGQLADMRHDERYERLFNLCFRLEDCRRNTSLHASGIVIGKTALPDWAPVMVVKNKDKGSGDEYLTATQYTMDIIENCGLVKMDYLGLKTLSIIKNTITLIRKKEGFEDFDIEHIDEHDEKAFKLFQEGRTEGFFQFESSGMQKYLRQLKPTCIEDLIAMNALYRPGPMDNIPQYIEGKNDPATIRYPHPSLEGILQETYGVIVYQEQVMQAAQILADYTLGGADMLRRAMGKKKPEEMKKQRALFVHGSAKKQGLDETEANKLFDLLDKFAGYGFNKSHAAAYAVVAYQTAYLKANFPVEFNAANFTNQIFGSDDKLGEYIDDARKSGIIIDAPDINRSEGVFTVQDGRIIYGFQGIKGIGEGPTAEIVKRREEGGEFTSFMNFLERVDVKAVSRKVVELLVKAGAFDQFGVSRATLAGNLDQAVDYVQKDSESRAFGQSGLFDDAPDAAQQSFKFAPKPDWTRTEKLRNEKELIGFYFSGHPMDDYKSVWEEYGTLNLNASADAEDGIHTVVGIIKDIKPHHAASGEMAFATIGDYNGDIDLVLFADAWARTQNSFAVDRVVAVRGKLDTSGGREKLSLLVDSALNLERQGLSQDAIRAFFSHPLDPYREAWDQNCDLNLAQAGGAKETSYTLVGVIRSVKPIQTKKGDEMAFATLEDFKGQIDLTIFSDLWEERRSELFVGKIIAVSGKLDTTRRPDKPGVVVKEFFDVDKMQADAKDKPKPSAAKAGGKKAPTAAPAARTSSAQSNNGTSGTPISGNTPPTPAVPEKRAVHIRLTEAAALADEALVVIREALLENPGKCAVYIHLPAPGNELVIRTTSQMSATADDEAIAAFSRCGGVDAAWTE